MEHETRKDRPATSGSLYRVVIYYDNKTPVNFAIHILNTVFLVPNSVASTIVSTAQLRGKAYVQNLPEMEAEKRIQQAHFMGKVRGYPLKFTMEPA